MRVERRPGRNRLVVVIGSRVPLGRRHGRLGAGDDAIAVHKVLVSHQTTRDKAVALGGLR